MTDERERLRVAVRTQEAIVRAVTDELGRKSSETEGLHDQAMAESARLISTMENLSRTSPKTGAAEPSAAPGQEQAAGRRLRVLLVDDDDGARNGIATWLSRDYDVVTACDGAEGLERAREALPDAIVADVCMPQMDGISMANRIRTLPASEGVPIIFLTGQSAPENVTAGFSAGGTAYLVKPVDLALLDDELRWALSLRRA